MEEEALGEDDVPALLRETMDQLERSLGTDGMEEVRQISLSWIRATAHAHPPVVGAIVPLLLSIAAAALAHAANVAACKARFEVLTHLLQTLEACGRRIVVQCFAADLLEELLPNDLPDCSGHRFPRTTKDMAEKDILCLVETRQRPPAVVARLAISLVLLRVSHSWDWTTQNGVSRLLALPVLWVDSEAISPALVLSQFAATRPSIPQHMFTAVSYCLSSFIRKTVIQGGNGFQYPAEALAQLACSAPRAAAAVLAHMAAENPAELVLHLNQNKDFLHVLADLLLDLLACKERPEPITPHLASFLGVTLFLPLASSSRDNARVLASSIAALLELEQQSTSLSRPTVHQSKRRRKSSDESNTTLRDALQGRILIEVGSGQPLLEALAPLTAIIDKAKIDVDDPIFMTWRDALRDISVSEREAQPTLHRAVLLLDTVTCISRRLPTPVHRLHGLITQLVFKVQLTEGDKPLLREFHAALDSIDMESPLDNDTPKWLEFCSSILTGAEIAPELDHLRFFTAKILVNISKVKVGDISESAKRLAALALIKLEFEEDTDLLLGSKLLRVWEIDVHAPGKVWNKVFNEFVTTARTSSPSSNCRALLSSLLATCPPDAKLSSCASLVSRELRNMDFGPDSEEILVAASKLRIAPQSQSATNSHHSVRSNGSETESLIFNEFMEEMFDEFNGPPTHSMPKTVKLLGRIAGAHKLDDRCVAAGLDLLITLLSLHPGDPEFALWSYEELVALTVEDGRISKSADLKRIISSKLPFIVPLALNRLLSNPGSVVDLACLLHVDPNDLWTDVKRLALPNLIRRCDFDSISKTAEKCQSSASQIVNEHLADVVSNALLSSSCTELSPKIEELSGKTFPELIWVKGNSIARILVTELGEGDGRERAARRALSLATQHLGETGETGSPRNAGQFLSRHFLFILDGLGQTILRRGPSEQRKRSLRSLKHVLEMSKESLHLYVPKTMALLKLALNDRSDLALVELTVEAWCSFIVSLGSKRAGPHLAAIVAVLNPHLRSSSGHKLCVALDGIIAGGPSRMPTDYLMNVVFVPPRPDTVHSSLQRIMKRVDDCVSRRQYGVNADLERFTQIASNHESRVVREAGLQALYCTLREAQSVMRDLRADGGSLLHTLVLSLSKICAEEDPALRRDSLACLGEVGAVDPSLLSDADQACQTSKNPFAHLFLNGPLSLATVLLSDYIIPALRRGEKQVGANQNILGFSIQELLKVCFCTEQTLELANKLVPGELSLANSEMDGASTEDQSMIGAKLWVSLSPEAQEAAMPYLKAELFVAKSNPGALRELRKHVGSTSDWIVEFCARLVDHLEKDSARNRVLCASRGVVRNDFRTAKFLFPFIVAMALEQETIRDRKEIDRFVISELMDCLTAGGESAQLVFYLWDAITSLLQVSKIKCERLEAIFSLHRESSSGLPLKSLASAARHVQSYPRAVLFMEQLIRTSGDRSYLQDLLEVFGLMGYSDGVAGITALRNVTDTRSQLMDLEATQNHEDALVLYEQLLADRPDSKALGRGFLRCMKSSAQWSSLLNYVSLVEKRNFNFNKDILEAGSEAAWRLGEWERLDNWHFKGHKNSEQAVDPSGGIFQFELGSMLNHLRSEDVAGFESAANKAKLILAPSVVSANLQGYEELYPSIVQMQSVAELQDAFQHKLRPEEVKTSLIHDDTRISIVRPTIEALEPILAVRAKALEVMEKPAESAKVYLQIAKICRKARSFRAAATAIAKAEKLSSQNFFVDRAKLCQARGQNQRAIGLSLRQLEILNKGGKAPEERRGMARLELLTGQWLEKGRASSSEIILDHLRRAVQLTPKEEKPLYTLGRYYDKLLKAAGKSEIERPGANLPLGARAIPMAPAVMGSESGASGSPEEYAPHVVENFASALECGQRYFYESMPRLLTLWFDYGSNCSSLTTRMRNFFEIVPKHLFVPVLPQMLSRLLHQSSEIKTLLVSMLVEILVEHPDQAIWFIVPVTRSKDKSRALTASQVLTTAGKLPGKNSLKKKLVAGKELIKELINVCCLNAQKQKKMVASRDLPRLRELVRTSTSILIPTQNSLTISIPPKNAGPYASTSPFPEVPVYFSSLEEEVLLMSSLMKPKKIEVLGSDGNGYGFLCKKEDSGDMRKDARFMEFVSVVNRAFRQNQASRRRELGIRTYAVLPLNEECGILEWVPNLSPLRNVLGPLHKEAGFATSVGDIKRAYDSKTCSSLEFLQNFLIPKLPPVLHRFFLKKFSDPTEWLHARLKFTNSVAVWSMVGYIVGLGDRHAENVSIETTTGACVHVDFACLFEKGLTLRIPEVVPFRLTPNMTDAMGVTGYEGPLRKSCEATIEVLRANHDALMAVLEAFIHDPLGEWEGRGKDRNLQNTYALRTRRSVEQKLLGVVGSGLPLSVQGQVERLLLEATNQKNLSSMYIWWMCWL